jgi:hypothetical protein
MHRIVSVPLDPALASFVGKEGSRNGIVFYNRKAGNDVIVALAPSSIADKFYGLCESMLVSRIVIVSTASVDKDLGEVLIALSLIRRRAIFTDDNDVSGFVSNLKISDFLVTGKEGILGAIAEYNEGSSDAAVKIDIDKSFQVKGVGSIVLGIVARGTVRVHDKLYHNSGKEVLIRSIQAQDEDILEAGPGTRVGLALKGIESDEVEKGDSLCAVRVPKIPSARCSIKMNSLANEKMERGKVYGFVSGFSYTEARIESCSDSEAVLSFMKDIPIEKGDEFLLFRQNGQVPRIFAGGSVEEAVTERVKRI